MKAETKVKATSATPGPWTDGMMIIEGREDDENYRFIKSGLGFFSEGNTGFRITGYMSPSDARLISAAPELLEALENLLKGRRKGDKERYYWLEVDIEADFAAEDAIKKARGL